MDLVANRAIADGLEDLQVLLVEDQPSNQMVLSRLLRRLCSSVTIQDNGRLALDHLKVHPERYGIIFSDCSMPVMDGFEFTLSLRRHELENCLQRTPVIGLTAHDADGIEKCCLEADMDSFLSKPISKALLEEAIRTWAHIPNSAKSNNDDILFGEAAEANEPPQPIQLPMISQQINLEELSGMLGLREPEILKDLILSFWENWTDLAGTIRSSCRAQDRQTMIEATHAAKGIARSCAAQQLSQRCAAIEQQLKSGGGWEGISRSVTEMEILARALKKDVARLKESP